MTTDKNIGLKFGRRTVIEKAHKNKTGEWYKFRCDCGEEKVLDLRSVKKGRSTRCPDCAMKDARKDRMNRKLFWNDLVDETKQPIEIKHKITNFNGFNS